MRRKKSMFNNYTPSNMNYRPPKQSLQDLPGPQERQYFPKRSQTMFPDSLERFQQEIQRSLILQKQMAMNNSKFKNRRRAITQAYDQDEEQKYDRQSKQMMELQRQLSELKGQIKSYKKVNPLEDKLDLLMEQMARNRELDRQLLRQQRNSVQSPPNNIFYPPPMPYYPPPDTRRDRRDTQDTRYSDRPTRPIRRTRRNFKKIAFAVVFTIFLKSQAKKLAQKRKNNLRTFYLQKFNSQMLNLKNWLVQGHSYAFPVILQKQRLSLNFWDEKRQQIAKEKQNLVLKIVQIGLEKTKQDCTPAKISLFSEIVYNICSRGSFVMSRFWSALQMKAICISQYYGCIRADESLQKCMLSLMIFVKVLVFNMLLQPHKFDSINFPKKKQPLTNNMHIIASVYYRLAKQLIQEYLDETRPAYIKLGNWLNVKEQFIVECCEPLIFDTDYPQPDEWISGMIGQQLVVLEESTEWGLLLGRMRQIIESLHRQMLKRRKDVVRNQKYKLYH